MKNWKNIDIYSTRGKRYNKERNRQYMSTLSDKYIAGFLDADGCIGVLWKKGKYKPILFISWSQKASQDKVLDLIHKVSGGYIRTKIRTIRGSDHKELFVTGKKAIMLLTRIKKYLVLKRYYAEICLEIVRKGEPIDTKKGSAFLKEQRKIKSLPLPNFPQRKWLAGYFDGDGCLYPKITKKGVAAMNFSIASSYYDTEGIEIIQKNFGGSIRTMSKGNQIQQLSCSMPPSKAKQFLGYFGKYLILKKDQADFILGCADMGHYRDGKGIKSALQHLKSRPHRLSSPECDVEEILSVIHDKQWGRHGHFDTGNKCSVCNTTERPHYAKGMCCNCYMLSLYHKKKHRTMRQSALCEAT